MRNRSSMIVAATCALVLVGCTSDPPEEEAAPADAVRAEWTPVSLPQTAFADEPRFGFSASVPGTKRLPSLLGGSSTPPGGQSGAALWSGPAGDAWDRKPEVLDLPGESGISELASDGAVTFASGYVRESGIARPYVSSSTDRETWEEMPLPDAMIERGLYAAEIIVRPDGTALSLGTDDDEAAAAVDLDSGEVIDLPEPESPGDLATISAVADGKTIVALARQSQDDGTSGLLGYRSTDAGQTWTSTGAPDGTDAEIAGVVAVGDGFLATGSLVQGTDDVAAAWYSDNGRRWFREVLPPLRDHTPGWDTALSAPATDGRTVSAAGMDEERLFTEVLRRSPGGDWASVGTSPPWETPEPRAEVQTLPGGGLAVARSWNGRAIFSTLTPSGSWSSDGPTFGGEPRVDFWSSLGLSGDTPILVGGRTEVDVEPDGGWTRSVALDRFAFTGSDSIESTPWDPSGSEGLSDIALAAAASGASVLVGERTSPSADPTESDESDLVGWYRKDPEKKWRRASGLSGPRTEFLGGVELLDGEWVATGVDRASFTSTDHSFGAIWTSKNGRAWRRARGPFDVAPTLDSSLSTSCRLASGDLLAVGSVEDPRTGSSPLAFRRTQGTWGRAEVAGLGADAQALNSCVGVGDVVLLRGSDRDGQRIWQTSDGTEFESVEIGGEEDVILDIEPVTGGFAAIGAQNEGELSRGVVWFSQDGTDWTPSSIPTDRDNVSGLVPWGDRLVVALAGSSGPEVLVLENPAELVDASGQ